MYVQTHPLNGVKCTSKRTSKCTSKPSLRRPLGNKNEGAGEAPSWNNFSRHIAGWRNILSTARNRPFLGPLRLSIGAGARHIARTTDKRRLLDYSRFSDDCAASSEARMSEGITGHPHLLRRQHAVDSRDAPKVQVAPLSDQMHVYYLCHFRCRLIFRHKFTQKLPYNRYLECFRIYFA